MGRPCSWTGLPSLLGHKWKAEMALKKTAAAPNIIKGLLCYPYAPGAAKTEDIGAESRFQELQ